jgi:hypothetical protein
LRADLPRQDKERYFIQHCDGEVEEISPADEVRITQDEVLVLFGGLLAAAFKRFDVVSVSREATPLPLFD